MRVEHLALVGLGSIGRRHLRLIRELRPHAKITLVRSGIGQAWPEEELAHNTVASIPEAIRTGVQAAIVASPSPLHVPQAIEFAQAGIHLLIEKPLSNNGDKFDELENIVLHNGVKVLIGYVLRHDPAARLFQTKLESPTIGMILHARIQCGSYLPDWRPEQDYRKSVSAKKELGGGVLLELSHELDCACWFFGRFNRVQALLTNSGTLGVDVEECAELLLETQSGLPIQIHIDFHRRHPKRTCKVQGTNGELCWDALTHEVSWKPAEGQATVDSIPFERDHLYRQQLRHFLACIEDDIPPSVTLKDGIAVMQLVEAARLSHQAGKRVIL